MSRHRGRRRSSRGSLPELPVDEHPSFAEGSMSQKPSFLEGRLADLFGRNPGRRVQGGVRADWSVPDEAVEIAEVETPRGIGAWRAAGRGVRAWMRPADGRGRFFQDPMVQVALLATSRSSARSPSGSMTPIAQRTRRSPGAPWPGTAMCPSSDTREWTWRRCGRSPRASCPRPRQAIASLLPLFEQLEREVAGEVPGGDEDGPEQR